MASTTLVKDVLYRVSVQLHDTSPQFTRWTQRELVNWLNDGQKAIAKYIPSSCDKVVAMKLSPGTRQSIEKILAASVIPGDGSTPADTYGNYLQSVVRNMGANGSTPGKAIRLVDREVLDATNPDWHTSTGSVVSQYVFDPRMPKGFYVYPGVPSATNVWVEISLLAVPANIPANGSYGKDDSDTTTISIEDKYVDDLVNYVLACAHLKDSEFSSNAALAAAHTQMFTASINAQVAAVTGVNPNLQSLPLNPGAAIPIPKAG